MKDKELYTLIKRASSVYIPTAEEQQASREQVIADANRAADNRLAKKDPRVIQAGRILRKIPADELPQYVKYPFEKSEETPLLPLRLKPSLRRT